MDKIWKKEYQKCDILIHSMNLIGIFDMILLTAYIYKKSWYEWY